MLPFTIHAGSFMVGLVDNAFTHVGFQDWKHAMGKCGIISAHDNCSSHKQAMACWNEYTINLEKHTSVAHRLETAHEQVVKTNRHYIKTLVEILLLSAKQEIAVRGHRESAESRNQGNFLEILKLVADHDAAIKEKKYKITPIMLRTHLRTYKISY